VASDIAWPAPCNPRPHWGRALRRRPSAETFGSTPEAFLRDFAGDLPADKARVLYAAQAPFKRTLLVGKTTHAAWRSKPSWYAVSTEDRTINPDLERFMAKRMGAKTIEVKASHVSLISQPHEIANLILDAAGHSG
jgi:hypothetical protein